MNSIDQRIDAINQLRRIVHEKVVFAQNIDKEEAIERNLERMDKLNRELSRLNRINKTSRVA